MKKYTHDEAWEALWKVLLWCDRATRKRLLAEAAAKGCNEMSAVEEFADLFCQAVAADDARLKFQASVDRLSEVKTALQVD